MTIFKFIPFGGSGGGGSSADRFAPKYLVGNTTNGDPDTVSVAGLAPGFNYYPDTGNCAQLRQALLDAAANPGDVWIRPGLYNLAAGQPPLAIPPFVRVQGAGESTFFTRGVDTELGLFTLNNGSELRDVKILVFGGSTAVTDKAVIATTGEAPSAYLERVNISYSNTSFDPTTLSAVYVGNGDTLTVDRCSVYVASNATDDPRIANQGTAGFRVESGTLLLDASTVIGGGSAAAGIITGAPGGEESPKGGTIRVEQSTLSSFRYCGVVGFGCNVSISGSDVLASSPNGIYLRGGDGQNETRFRLMGSEVYATSIVLDLDVRRGQVVGSTITGFAGINSINATGEGVAIGFNTVIANPGQHFLIQPVDEQAHNITV